MPDAALASKPGAFCFEQQWFVPYEPLVPASNYLLRDVRETPFIYPVTLRLFREHVSKADTDLVDERGKKSLYFSSQILLHTTSAEAPFKAALIPGSSIDVEHLQKMEVNIEKTGIYRRPPQACHPPA